jgi:hypothetical protein
VTSGEPENWPGRETDPALSLPPSRDFDGGLLRRWSFALTSQDALVWLRLTRPLTRRARRMIGLCFFLTGAAVALLPSRLVGPFGSSRFELILLACIALELALIYGLRAVRQRRLARALVPTPRPAVFEEWVDCIAVTEIDSEDEAYLSPELIGEVILTRRHIVVKSHSSTLLIPTRAFASPTEAVAMARHIAELSKGPYYFDAQD